MKFDGFEWDEGNWPKCGKHGVSRQEIESVFLSDPVVAPDPFPEEERLRAIGTPEAGKRPVFVVFMLREDGPARLIRPISARYMHDKEVKQYERYRPAEG